MKKQLLAAILLVNISWVYAQQRPVIRDESDPNSRFRQYERYLNRLGRTSNRTTHSFPNREAADSLLSFIGRLSIEAFNEYARGPRPNEGNFALYVSSNTLLEANLNNPRQAVLVFLNDRHVHMTRLILPATAAERRNFGIQMGIFLHNNMEGSLQVRNQMDRRLRRAHNEHRNRNTPYNQFLNGVFTGWTGTWGGHRFPDRNLPQYTPAPRRRNGNNTNDGDGKVTAINIQDSKGFDQYVVYNLNGQLVVSTTDADFASHLSPGTYMVASKQGLQKPLKLVR